MSNKDNKANLALGLGVGAVMAGGVWYFMRLQDRKALVDLFNKDAKIPVLRALATAVPIPPKLENVANGQYDLIAESEILFTNTVSPREVYAKYATAIQSYVSSVPENAVDKVVKSLGLDPKLVDTVKSWIDTLAGKAGSDSGVKQRPGT